ncbi:autotransporter outer membrane beta-barrel domain-containing protein, partial [Anaerobiospirillum succiniciproducens]|uniref:autotransporter outer membrane beta-barrel domain-containing protein n=1 Tax=Anaerobiospirillum succiniciproducens TaxID=13335 RepID=UPI002942403B
SGSLNVASGEWGVKTLTVTKGKAIVAKEAQLNVTKSLTTTNADGKLEINGGTVNAKDVETLKLNANGASITNAGKLILSAGKVVKSDFTLDSGNYAKSAVDGTTDAKISLLDDSGNAISMTLEQFKQFRTDTGFKGLFDINLKDKPTTQPQMGLGGTDGVIAGVTNGYESVQGKVDSTGVTDNYFVGNTIVSGSDTVALQNGGALTLTNANANGANGQYVTVDGVDKAVGNVKFEADNTLVLGGAGGKIGSVTAKTDRSGSVTIADGANVEVVKDSFGDSTNALGTVNIKDGAQLNVKSGSVFTSDLKVGKGGYVFASGDVVVKKTATIMGDVDATNLTLSGTDTAGAKVQHAIAGGATIDADKLSLAENNTLTVGKDGKDTSSANVFVGTLDLAANSIIVVDPEPYKPAALVVAEDLDGKKNDKDAGTLKGGAYVGMNSALGIGFTEAEFNDVMASYLVDGKFDQNGLKNALVLNKAVTIANGNGIVVNAGLTVADAQTTAPDPNTLVLESGAGLIITDNAFGADKSQAAITFASGSATPNKVDAKVLAVDGAKISLVGDITAKDTGLKIFAAQGTGSTVTASGDLVVEAAGGLLTYTYTSGTDLSTTGVTLKLDPEVEKQIRSLVSAPVGQMFVDYANGEFSGASGLGYDFVVNTLTAKQYGAIDAAAHAATYAGAQQAAVAAVTTMADAMFGRVGAVGVEAATISATGSQANGGVWLTPMYKSVDSDGFNAEGVSYGSDVDLAGVAFGTDTVNGNMRFGAVFNIGSGDAEGKGQGNGLKDEFDYYGFGIYSAMGFGNFALVGDASMTVISHDVEGFGLSGKADTKAVTMGLTGQYTISTAAVDVTPHLGARFIRLNTDSYDLMSADGAIATTDFDVQNVFSIPLGVTLSKAFSTSGWTLAPSADLTVAFNTGDTEAKSHTQFNSTKPMAVAMNTEVLDEVQYGLTVGLGAQNGAFGTSFGINYTGSSNTDSFGVNAQCRYMF